MQKNYYQISKQKEDRQKYLNIDKGYGWVVRAIINGKSFVVWSGRDREFGVKVARKVEELMKVSKTKFLNWYDYDKEQYLDYLKRRERCKIGKI